MSAKDFYIEAFWSRYFSYPTRKLLTESHNITTFPKIMICANSQHSIQRLKEKYHAFTEDMLAALYELSKKLLNFSMNFW